ncbi:MAG: chorismate mutase [Phormidesmis sp.]
MGKREIAKEETAVDWQMRAIRGATTVPENSAEAIAEAVTEMLDALESQNQLDPAQIVSATFSVTRDLDAIFPAAIARARPRWDSVPLLDVQQMHVKGSLARCVRLMIHIPLPICQSEVRHAYLRGARDLRPDLCLTSD